MAQRKFASMDSVIGKIFIVVEGEKIGAVYLGENDFRTAENDVIYDAKDPLLRNALEQMNEYFSGKRKNFELPAEQHGTSFQKSVWEKLKEIPYGMTKSYQEIAIAIGNEKAVRAIGQANKANRLPIIVPCHRVIGKNKSLTGYAGNRKDIKKILLQLEGADFREE